MVDETTRITIRLAPRLLERIREAVRGDGYVNQADFVRQAIHEKLGIEEGET